MTAFRTLRVAGLAILAAFIVLPLFHAVQAQPAGQGGVKRPPVDAVLPQQKPTQQRVPASSPVQQQTAPINVEITGLSMSPSPPRSGQPATVKLTIRNAGSAAVARVPWAIHLYTGNQTLGRGEQTNVAPGASFEATANWIPAAGRQVLQGYVDPTGSTFKNTAPANSQVKTLEVNVALSAVDTALQQLVIPGNVRSLRITLQPDANAAAPQWTRPAIEPILHQFHVPGDIRSLRITLQPDANAAPPQWTRPATEPILQQLAIPTNVRSLRITLQPEGAPASPPRGGATSPQLKAPADRPEMVPGPKVPGR